MYENERRNLAEHLGENWPTALLYVHLQRGCPVCAHEAGHIAAARQPALWSIASDMAINTALEEEAIAADAAIHARLHVRQYLGEARSPCSDLPGVDDALVKAPGVDEARWSDVNRKFCELFREMSD